LTTQVSALAMFAGIGVRAAAVQPLHAQTKPRVYFIAENDVTNPEGYTKEYLPCEAGAQRGRRT